MSPIFCNSKVHFDHWGQIMQQYSLSHNEVVFNESRKLLIGGMAAKNIFLASNLPILYLEKALDFIRSHGIEI